MEILIQKLNIMEIFNIINILTQREIFLKRKLGVSWVRCFTLNDNYLENNL